MLIACDACHRQYDVGSHEVGAQVRCFCGARLTVPAARSREARMAHCSSCGAGLPDGSTECGFCGSGVGLGNKGFGDTCPSCYARMLKDARFCNDCGTEIRPAAVIKALIDQDCPRCHSHLSECTAGDTQFVECTTCGGLWLGESTFEQLTSRRENTAPPPVLTNRSASRTTTRDVAEDLRKVVYLQCPVCKERMNRRNFARSSGVIIDWCRGHGFWFDAEELERVLAFVDQGGMDRQREREKEELERERRRAESARRDVRLPVTTATRRVGSFDPSEGMLSTLARLVARVLS